MIAAAVFFVGAFATYIFSKSCGAEDIGLYYVGACVIFGFAMLLPSFLESGQSFLFSFMFIMLGAYAMLWLDVENILSRAANMLTDVHVPSGRMMTFRHWSGWATILTFLKLLFGDFGSAFKDKLLDPETA